LTFSVGETVMYPQHGAATVERIEKRTAFDAEREYLVLRMHRGDMVVNVPVETAAQVGVRPPASPEEIDDIVAVLAKTDVRVPSNWSRRFKNHQEKMKTGDVYQVAEVVRNLAVRKRTAELSSAERTMYERAREILLSELGPALSMTEEEAEAYLDSVVASGSNRPAVPTRR
jgi:CarD family transcriptional regulator